MHASRIFFPFVLCARLAKLEPGRIHGGRHAQAFCTALANQSRADRIPGAWLTQNQATNAISPKCFSMGQENKGTSPPRLARQLARPTSNLSVAQLAWLLVVKPTH